MDQDELFMQRCLDLAEGGCFHVSPNPRVGCVLVKDGITIGEGFHERYGQAHAEVNAIRSVDNPNSLKGATAYVNLEPCSHFGKTPPCVDLLIEKGIQKVVICNTDPHPLVSGKGIEKLKQAKVEIQTGILETQGLELNKRFFKGVKENRPYIILKWTQSSDGFIGRQDQDPIKISNEDTDRLVHKWRAEEDAIMIGRATAQYDNPKLNNRLWIVEKQPVRVVFDSNLKLPHTHHIFDQNQKTLIFNKIISQQKGQIEYIATVELPEVMKELFNRNIRSVLVEGGAMLHTAFVYHGLVDEIRKIVSPLHLQRGLTAIGIPGGFYRTESYRIRQDEIYIYKKT